MYSYRNVLNRLDMTLSSWKAWNFIAFILIPLKKIRKREKSKEAFKDNKHLSKL